MRTAAVAQDSLSGRLKEPACTEWRLFTECREHYVFFLPFVALPALLFPLALAAAFFFDVSAGALPKTLSQPLTNFLDAPVCTVYPVIVILSLIQNSKSSYQQTIQLVRDSVHL